jgi:putative heme transporter
VAAVLEAGSYCGYIVLFRRVFVRPGSRLGWRESYAITMAGVAATRVLATVAQGVRGALAMLRAHDPALLGALAWWGFDIAVLWACFHGFGEPPPTAVIVMAYFTGMLGNLLPLPGGVGGVEGGMIGAFLAFGVPGGLALVAVLTYRAFAFWLPTVPGLLAYLQLRRTSGEWSRPGL